jgi:ferritin-like metal-binding protein YciE
MYDFFGSFFDWSDHFDQMLSHIFSQERQIFKMFHKNAHGLVKFAILNGHT